MDTHFKGWEVARSKLFCLASEKEIDPEILSMIILSLPLIQERVISFCRKNLHNT